MLARLLFFIYCFSGFFAHGQFHELGLFIGGSNYIGDIGTNRYLDPNSPAVGVIYKWNITERYSFRGGLTFTTLRGIENNNSDLNRYNRAYTFENGIQDATLGVEFNFKTFNLHDADFNFSPYLFYGISYFRYNQLLVNPSGPLNQPDYTNYGKEEKFAIPFILGFKLNPNPLLVLGLETGIRYTFTDNLDGSNPENQYVDEMAYKFGNIGNNDWYLFMGLTISFTFGDLPCYCKE
ncbi:MAG: DUF6089 family protein [Flavobacteriaceae bacterium]|jgi:hypothetical protein